MAKHFNNSKRKQQDKYASYVPQYKQMGIQPKKIELGHNGSHDQFSPLIGKDKSDMINIGSVDPQEWASVDGSLTDDLDIEQGQVIDNNDFVEIDGQKNYKDDASSKPDDLSSLEINDYIIFHNGNYVFSGSQSETIDCIKKLIYGEHPLCKEGPIDPEELLLLKNVEIKIGVFIE